MSKLDLDYIETELNKFLSYKIISEKEYYRNKEAKKLERIGGNLSINSYQECMSIFVRVIEYVKSFLENLKSSIKLNPSNKEIYLKEISRNLELIRSIFNKNLPQIKLKLRLFKKTYYLGREQDEVKHAMDNILWMSINIYRRHIRDIWRGILIKGGDDIIQKYREKFPRAPYFYKPKKKPTMSDEEPRFDTDDMLEECKIKIKLILK